MPGIITIYVLHAEEQINLHVSNGTQHEISRRAIEHEIMHELDSYSFPIDMKLSWYNTILYTDTFEAFWLGHQARHNLEAHNVAKYVAVEKLRDYEVPDDMKREADKLKEQISEMYKQSGPAKRAYKPRKKRNARSSKSSETSAIPSYEETNTSQNPQSNENGFNPEPERSDPSWHQDNEHARQQASGFPLIDPNGLNRQTGDDGDFRSPARVTKKGGAAKGRRGAATGPSPKRARVATPASNGFVDGQTEVGYAGNRHTENGHAGEWTNGGANGVGETVVGNGMGHMD